MVAVSQAHLKQRKGVRVRIRETPVMVLAGSAVLYLVLVQTRYILTSYVENKDSWVSAKVKSEACSSLPRGGVGETWLQNLEKILMASKHPDDPDFSHREWTQSLLAEVPPDLMKTALKSWPSHASLYRIAKKLTKREAPLRVAVVGGAVSEGKACDIASVQIPPESIMANPLFCAWPYRLEQFVNSFLGYEALQLVNMAEEGTETALITPLIRNSIYPKPLMPQGPDVIINAYSTNDYTSDFDLQALIQKEMTAFLQSMLSSSCQHPPLLIHLFDSPLSRFDPGYPIISLNYNLPISKLTNFDNVIDRLDPDISFGMAGHLAIVWLIVYTFLDLFHSHCTAKLPLTPTPNLNTCTNQSHHDSCIFAWFSGPAGTVDKPHEIQQYIDTFVTQNTGWRAVSDISTGFSRKAGLEPFEEDASITLEFKNITKEIEFIDLMTVKSYLSKFEDSRARFTINIKAKGEKKQPQEIIFEVVGYHTSSTHVTFPVEVDLKGFTAPVGSHITIRIDLISGTTFKIIGMLLCS